MIAYKAVRKMKDGKLKSQYVDKAGDFRFARLADFPDTDGLYYSPGEITEAPDNTAGIFCYTGKEDYKFGNTPPSFYGEVLVFRVTGVGKLPRVNGQASYCIRFKSIRLGKRPVAVHSYR